MPPETGSSCKFSEITGYPLTSELKFEDCRREHERKGGRTTDDETAAQKGCHIDQQTEDKRYNELGGKIKKTVSVSPESTELV